MPRYPLLLVPTEPAKSDYTAVNAGGGRRFDLPPRRRRQHADDLLASINEARDARPDGRVIGNGYYEPTDVTLQFDSDPDFELAFESLDLPRSGIDLLSVKKEDGRTVATVRLPEDKLTIFIRKLEKYRDADPNGPVGPNGRRPPDNRKLAESISNIRRASLRSLWTDTVEFPAAGQNITWEVWLRAQRPGEDAPEVTLAAAQRDFGFVVAAGRLQFVDRTVVLVRGTAEQLALGLDFLGIIAELRRAKSTAGFFDDLPAVEQHDWIVDLVARTEPAADGAPVVGLLDTGVNRAHPLLEDHIAARDVRAYKPNWPLNDGPPRHGTQMAGLALYGDLAERFEDDNGVAITHGLRSIKIFNSDDAHEPELYGAVTQGGIAELEIMGGGPIVYTMAITSDGRDRGRPTSWSAAMDEAAFTDRNGPGKLIIVSAGNIDPGARGDYPAVNETSSIQDPAQAWNVLTVGGMTAKTLITDEDFAGYIPLASEGDLAPGSTTSLTWLPTTRWPFKPDIVMEAGNMARPAADLPPDFVPDLSVLTTNDRFAIGHRPLTTMRDTSAATALAARLAAALAAAYPTFTAETVRGMMVHAARWTDAMRLRATVDGRVRMHNLLRTFGYGTPDRDMLFSCARNELTLIVQDELQPFIREDGRLRTKDLAMHALPWPTEALQALPPDTQVTLRVTLSYFIEPSPGERGWDKKYGYASHGLRFRVQRPTETPEEFALRINTFERDDDYDDEAHQDEVGEWALGAVTPANGSLHSNRWTGSAAELANRSHVAVYPTNGWWRSRPSAERIGWPARYSLIVTLETPAVETDIYTPVATQIGIESLIPIEILV